MNPFAPVTPFLGTAPALPKTPAPGAGPADLETIAKDFESIFVFQMLDAMYAGLPTDGAFGGGQGEQMFRSLMNEEIAKSISASGGFGIAQAVHRELLTLQEMHNGNPPR